MGGGGYMKVYHVSAASNWLSRLILVPTLVFVYLPSCLVVILFTSNIKFIALGSGLPKTVWLVIFNSKLFIFPQYINDILKSTSEEDEA